MHIHYDVANDVNEQWFALLAEFNSNWIQKPFHVVGIGLVWNLVQEEFEFPFDVRWDQLLDIDVEAGWTISSALLLEEVDWQRFAVKVLAKIRAYIGEFRNVWNIDENAQELPTDLVALFLVSRPNLQAELDLLLFELGQLWRLIMFLH